MYYTIIGVTLLIALIVSFVVTLKADKQCNDE